MWKFVFLGYPLLRNGRDFDPIDVIAYFLLNLYDFLATSMNLVADQDDNSWCMKYTVRLIILWKNNSSCWLKIVPTIFFCSPIIHGCRVLKFAIFDTFAWKWHVYIVSLGDITIITDKTRRETHHSYFSVGQSWFYNAPSIDTYRFWFQWALQI